MTQAIAYTRCNQGNAEKLRRQRDSIAAWSAQTGIPILAWYTDEQVSGKARLADCAGLRGALMAAKQAENGLLVATAFDRLSRTTPNVVAVLEDLYRHGGKFMTTAQADDALTRGWLSIQQALPEAKDRRRLSLRTSYVRR